MPPEVFVNVSVMFAAEAEPLADPPVIPALRTGAGHVKVTPSAGFVKLSRRIL